jgi:hypothetical protein
MAHLNTTRSMTIQSFVFQQRKQQLLNQDLLASLLVVLAMANKWRPIKSMVFALL